MIHVLLVEDQKILVDSLARALNKETGFLVIGTLADANDVLAFCTKQKPDLILMDICTENDASGLEAAAVILTKFPEMKIVLMTAMSDIGFVREAKKIGVTSFVYKNIPFTELVSVLHHSAGGHGSFPQTLTPEQITFINLKERELQVLRSLCLGNTRKEIAAQLKLSENTVKHYTRELLCKTGFSSVAKLASYVLSNNLIKVFDQQAEDSQLQDIGPTRDPL